MQSGQDCLIYHMLGNSLRRLHVSRTKIGSLLTEWFAEAVGRAGIQAIQLPRAPSKRFLPAVCTPLSKLYSGYYKDF